MTAEYSPFVSSTIKGINDQLVEIARIEAITFGKTRNPNLSYVSVRDTSIEELDSICHNSEHRVTMSLRALVAILVSFPQSKAYLKHYDAISREVASEVKRLLAAIPEDSEWLPVAALKEFLTQLDK